MFQVFQGDKPADNNSYPELKGDCWSNSVFESKREAEIYAYLWAYPVSKEVAEANAPQMDVDKEYDYGMGEEAVPMMIRQQGSSLDDIFSFYGGSG